MQSLGISIQRTDDVMLMSYVLDCGKFSHHLLSSIVKEYLNAELIAEKDVLSHNRVRPVYLHAITGDWYWEETTSSCKCWHCKCHTLGCSTCRCNYKVLLNWYDDVVWPLHRVLNALSPRMSAENVQKVYDTIDMPLVQVLAEMEMRGVLVSEDDLNQLAEQFEGRIQSIQEQIYQTAGTY